MTAEEVKALVRNVPDFPIKGIQFKDITTALDNPEGLRWMRDEMVRRYKDLGITKIVGIESRGFILAPAVAMEIGAGFVPIRKPGKLPAETVEVSYAKEYGVDTIQIHKDALVPNDVVLIHDDILATGGTACGIAEQLNREVVTVGDKQYKVKVKEFLFLVEFPNLYDHDRINAIAPVHSFIQIDGE